MKNKIEITKYDKPRARWYFALFKFLELFGVFLFTFGFYGLGSLVYKHLPGIYNHITRMEANPMSYYSMWLVGFIIFLWVILALLLIGSSLYVIYHIIKAWVKGNWKMAKSCAEYVGAKAKRLKQQGLELKIADRERWGYCVGDEVKIVLTQNGLGKQFVGTKGKILEICNKGAVKLPQPNSYWWDKVELKITKKQNLKRSSQ